jgi:hypothetical protein
MHDRLALFADQAEGDDLAELERCATQDKSVLCRLALAFRYRHGVFSSGGEGVGGVGREDRCDMAATHYRLAADHAVRFSQVETDLDIIGLPVKRDLYHWPNQERTNTIGLLSCQ